MMVEGHGTSRRSGGREPELGAAARGTGVFDLPHATHAVTPPSATIKLPAQGQLPPRLVRVPDRNTYTAITER